MKSALQPSCGTGVSPVCRENAAKGSTPICLNRQSHAPLPLWLCLATVVMFIIGCQEELMPTPNLYLDSGQDPFRDVPAVFQSSRVDLIYATDREPTCSRQGVPGYSYKRSHSLRVGTCSVQIGEEITWNQLAAESRRRNRSRSLPVKLAEIGSPVVYPPVPLPLKDEGGQLRDDPEALALEEQANAAVHKLLAERLALSPRKEVFLFVHGVGNRFEDAAYTMAGMWHFLGRIGVPVIYSWPAGYEGGLLQWYTHDRESAEFTVYHLKQFLLALASCPDLATIHIVAHSRGTDVIMSALRELNIACRAADEDCRGRLKLGNLVLVASDLDLDVVSQRIGAERVVLLPERLTVYLSETDKAMSAANWLFGSIRRLGGMRPADLTSEQRAVLGMLPRLQLIQVWVTSDFIGHSYFYKSPAVLSDLILLLRDGRDPGDRHGRPLARRFDCFWELRDGYPRASLN